MKTTNFIAHRGLHEGNNIPENSILAFEKAVENNYGIELDITISNDNQIVVFHDDTLDRLCNISGNIEDYDYKFLRQQKLYESNEKIPLLSEVLKVIGLDTLVLIEIKKHKNIGVLEDILCDLLSNNKGKYFICSFEKDILYWFKKNRPKVKRGLIFESLPKKFDKYNKVVFLYKYFKTQPNYVSLNYQFMDSSIYEFCKKKSLSIYFWTINSSERFHQVNKDDNKIIFESITP